MLNRVLAAIKHETATKADSLASESSKTVRRDRHANGFIWKETEQSLDLLLFTGINIKMWHL